MYYKKYIIGTFLLLAICQLTKAQEEDSGFPVVPEEKKPLQVEQDFWMQLFTYMMYPISLFMCIDSEYVYEDCLNAGGVIIVNEIVAFIENDPSLRKIGLLSTATSTVKTIAAAATEVKVGDKEMIQAFNTKPDWDYYIKDDESTNVLYRYWTLPEIGGGTITEDLIFEGNNVETPITSLIASTTTYGFIELNKIQYSIREDNFFYDIKLLATAENDAKTLEKLMAFKDDVKCCWTGGHDIETKVNGFARVIRYKDTKNGGNQPEYAVIMWEGQVSNGIPKGFCRYIYGITVTSFIGYMDGFELTQSGLGLFLENDELVFSGYYEEGTFYENQRPGRTITLEDLAEMSKRYSCGTGQVKDPLDSEGKKCITDPKIATLDMFREQPEFQDYTNNDELGSTEIVKTYWSTTDMGGGNIVDPLKTPSQPEMATPINDLINNVANFGYFEIYKIQDIEDSTTFYDVWVLAVSEPDAPILGNLQTQYTDKNLRVCCWTGGNDILTADISTRINGYGRVIKYTSENDAFNKDQVIAMWEGKLANGVPYGFTRFIQGLYTSEMFIGSLATFDSTKKGPGIWIQNNEEKFSGQYAEGTNYREEEPVPEEIKSIIEECKDYTYANEQKDDCINDLSKCTVTQILNVKGKCEDCAAYTFPDEDQRVCNEKVCDPKWIITKLGACEICPIFNHPDDTQRNCISDEASCQDDEFLTQQGRCQTCANYFYPNPEKKSVCIADKCDASSIQLKNGRCEQCPNYTRPDARNQRTCVSDISQCSEHEKVDATGVCERCPNYYFPDEAQHNCIQNECPGEKEIRLLTGECQTCGSYFYAFEKRQCATEISQCTTKQIITVDGRCETCPDYHFPDKESHNCITETCEAKEYKKLDGTCEPCEMYTYTSASGTSCVSDIADCTARDFLTEEGKCSTCPSYTYVSDDGKSCVSDETACTSRAILNIVGKCQDCLTYTYPDETSRACISDEALCLDRQYLNIAGKCEYCLDYTYRDSTKRGCTSDLQQCTDRQILKKSGRCEDCEDYTYPEAAARRTCQDDSASCSAFQILNKLGRCEACDDGFYVDNGQCLRCNEYNYVDANDGGCKQETCTGQDYLETTGRCATCPEHYSPDPQRRKCIQAGECTSRQVRNALGHCADCDDYTYPNTDTNECVSDQASCTAKEVLNVLGRCEECDSAQNKMYVKDNQCEVCADYHFVDDAGNCVQNTCTGRQHLGKDGKCKNCDDFTYPDGTGKNCIADACDSAQRQYLDEDGTCHVCESYTYVDDSGKKCVSDTCKPHEQKTQEGTCSACEEYTHLDSTTGRSCVAEACSAGKYLRTDGWCDFCPWYTRVQADGKSCSADTCGANEYILRDGTCRECPEYHYVDDSGKTCTYDRCQRSKGEYLGLDGRCQSCPANTHYDTEAGACSSVSCPKYTYATEDGLCKAEVCVAGEVLLSHGRCLECPPGWEPNIKGSLCVEVVCKDYFFKASSGVCLQEDCSISKFSLDKAGRCTVSRCQGVRNDWKFPPANAYANLDDLLQGYNIFLGTPFSKNDRGFATQHSVYDWSKVATDDGWAAPKGIAMDKLSACAEDTEATTALGEKALQQFYFDQVTLDVGLSFTRGFDPFGNGAFRGGPDFEEQLRIMSGGKYPITVATAECLVFRASISETTPPCLAPELLDAIETLKADNYSEEGMNAFFDEFGTHAILKADFGSKFVTSAKFKAAKYYRNKVKNLDVVFDGIMDYWGQESNVQVGNGVQRRFVPDPTIKQIAAYALGTPLPEAATTAERLQRWADVRDDILEDPQIAANMHLITLPAYLMDRLQSEDAEGKLTNDEARAILRLGKHLEDKYCLYLQSKGHIASCEPAEAPGQSMNVVLEETSTDHQYYKTTTVNPNTDSSTYYGHSECFKKEYERGRTCRMKSFGRGTESEHCGFTIERGSLCKNQDWQSCWSGPWLYEPCSFKKDGITYQGECNEDGQCEGDAYVQVNADGQTGALEACNIDDCSDYRGRQARTVTGKTCQAWAKKYPHYHTRTPQNFPGAGLEENYCRNPDGDETIWCYTTDPGKRWEFCKPLAT